MEAPVLDARVFFGITGDLAFNKIFPALQAIVHDGGGATTDFIGVASATWTLDAVNARMRDSLAAHAGGVDEGPYRAVSELLRYVGGDYRDAALYERLMCNSATRGYPLRQFLPGAVSGIGTTCTASRSRWPRTSEWRDAAGSTRRQAHSETWCRPTCCK